jgi:CheY-like chemotaxis protein
MNVLILDDDDERHAKFAEQYRHTNCVHAHTFEEARQALLRNMFDLVQLDHDLNYNQYRSVDRHGRELSGQDVAQLIANLDEELIPGLVVIHSRNLKGALAIEQILKGRVKTERDPFGGQYTEI